MSNPWKLVLVVLAFFLALTYVRGFEVEVPTHDIVFRGNQPFEYSLVISNSSLSSIRPRILADGPFQVLVAFPNPLVIPPRSNKVIEAQLIADPSIEVGDTYHGQLRVVSGEGEQRIPLTLTKQEGPALDFAGVGVTGLVTGFSPAADPVINGILVLIILLLLLSLFFRIKNRWGGKPK